MISRTEAAAETILRLAQAGDAERLADLAERTFVETFVEVFAIPYSAADLASFTPQAFSAERFAARITEPSSRVWVAEREGSLIGYAVAGRCGLPHPDAEPTQGELKNLYVAREAQGFGVGGLLLDEALGWLERDFGDPLWIGVWSGNARARAVYEARGFAKVGEYGFPVGGTIDREFILRRG